MISALTSKGFSYDASRDHIFLTFEHEEKTQAIYTKVSHSGKDIGASLISRMARQCKLTKKQFLQLVDCDIDGPGYVEIMRERGLIASD